MRCLIVGTDNLGTMPNKLQEKFSIREAIHWDGRRRKLPFKLPKGTSLILVYTGFVQHGLMWHVKKLAQQSNVRIIYLRRGMSELERCS